MSITRSEVFRELGLAVSHASCESPAALDNAIEAASRALEALRELRAAARPKAPEHISTALARALRALPRPVDAHGQGEG